MRRFFEEQPALVFGLSALFGSFLYFENTWWLAGGWIFLHLIILWKRGLLQAALVFLFYVYCALLFASPPTCGEGRAVFSVNSIHRTHSPFSSGWLYKGKIRAFESEAGRRQLNLPCTIATHEKPLKHQSDYLLEGKLCENGRFNYSFKPKIWKPIEGKYSLAKLRLQVKEKIRLLLHQHMRPRAAGFITALFTGEIEDRSLSFEFGRLGLQHILAISGFHFALVAAFVSLLLRPLFSYRSRIIVLLGAVFLYFILVGNSPAVLRSFLAAALFLFGRLMQKRSSGLNLLGACLLFEIAFNPLAVLQVGFQLSFLSCGAILLLNAPLRRILLVLFPQRTLKESARLPLFSQVVYICSSYISRALSLTLAVNLAIFPLLLHEFHRFPLLSLFYNLFIPPLSALCLFLLLPALALYPLLPLLSLPFFKTASILAGELLEIVAYPPALLDVYIAAALPGWILAPWLGILFLGGIYFRCRNAEKIII